MVNCHSNFTPSRKEFHLGYRIGNGFGGRSMKNNVLKWSLMKKPSLTLPLDQEASNLTLTWLQGGGTVLQEYYIDQNYMTRLCNPIAMHKARTIRSPIIPQPPNHQADMPWSASELWLIVNVRALFCHNLAFHPWNIFSFVVAPLDNIHSWSYITSNYYDPNGPQPYC